MSDTDLNGVDHRPAPETLDHETAIVWLQDPTGLRYLREGIDWTPTRTRRPRRREGLTLIGHAVLGPGAQKQGFYFQRRCWCLKSGDPYEGAGGPVEAVDPKTVVAGKPTPSYFPELMRQAAAYNQAQEEATDTAPPDDGA